jgi:hypothetical protein
VKIKTVETRRRGELDADTAGCWCAAGAGIMSTSAGLATLRTNVATSRMQLMEADDE